MGTVRCFNFDREIVHLVQMTNLLTKGRSILAVPALVAATIVAVFS